MNHNSQGWTMRQPYHKEGKESNMYSINFQKAKRNFMTVTFEDEKPDGTPYNHIICVGMPKKRIFDELLSLDELDTDDEPQSRAEKNQINRRRINALYDVVATILSNNLAKEKITAEWVGDMMNTDEVKEFLQEYSKFARGEAANPN